MVEFLWLGTALGAILGFAHAACLYREIAVRAPVGQHPGSRLRGLYFALWALLLWTLFGAYVLAFWILGILVYPIVRLIRGPRTAS